MPRLAGQVDESKTEAILEAATALFGEKGPGATMDAIARRAGVSKQTLYNRFSSRTEIGRALASRRSDAISAPLRAGEDTATVLKALAVAILDNLHQADAGAQLRGVALMSPEMPELADAIYQAGPVEGLRRLSLWLAEQDRLGLLSIPDPAAAAEMYTGMVLGYEHLRCILGVVQPPFDIDQRAAEAAKRFMAAFAA